MQSVRAMGRTLAVLTLAILTTFQSAVMSSAEPVVDEVEDGGVEIVVDDFADDGTLIATTVERYRQVDGGGWQHAVGDDWVPLPIDDGDEPGFEPVDPGIGLLGSTTLPAPSARTGCRTVWGRTWHGYEWAKFYHLENRVRFCYNKTTHKVSGAGTTWDVLDNDGLSDIPNPTNTIGYYTWDSGVSNSGYRSLRQWHVTRTFAGATDHYDRRVTPVHARWRNGRRRDGGSTDWRRHGNKFG